MIPDKELTISELLEALADANDKLRLAQSDARAANARERECTSVVNELQRAINSRLIELKEKSPRGTDWAKERGYN